MCFAAHGDTVAERLQIVDDALGARVGESVIRISAGLEGGLTGVDIVTGGRAGGGRLEAVVETHALCGEAIHVRGVGLPSVAADIEIAEIVGEDKNEVGFGE